MKRLGDLVGDGRTSLERFLALHADPVLLHAEPLGGGDEREFRTRLGGGAPSRLEMALELALRPDLLVTPVRKGPAGAFQGQISVGRTRASDLSFPYARLSKFHAYFTWAGEPRAYSLTDAGSTNGTFVDGRRLEPKAPAPVPDGAYVTFGHYHFLFLTPPGLYRALNQLSPAP
ncbi:MAG TPA: FHA domain-containing protein [Polyangiaceae bacterium]|nr:FHA domain-containing protein [Polyangiaceae bacterium]